MRAIAVIVAALIVLLLIPTVARSGTHAPGSTSRAARSWHAPPGFIRQALCIHAHESADWYRRWVDWRGRPSVYAGGMQFLQSTWERAGGTGQPWQWSPREQVYRAFVIWRLHHGSWSEWGSRGACGLA